MTQLSTDAVAEKVKKDFLLKLKEVFDCHEVPEDLKKPIFPQTTNGIRDRDRPAF